MLSRDCGHLPPAPPHPGRRERTCYNSVHLTSCNNRVPVTAQVRLGHLLPSAPRGKAQAQQPRYPARPRQLHTYIPGLLPSVPPGAEEGFPALNFHAGPSGGQCLPVLRRTCCTRGQRRAVPSRAGWPPAGSPPLGARSPLAFSRRAGDGGASVAALPALTAPPSPAVPSWPPPPRPGRCRAVPCRAGGRSAAQRSPAEDGVHPGGCGAKVLRGRIRPGGGLGGGKGGVSVRCRRRLRGWGAARWVRATLGELLGAPGKEGGGLAARPRLFVVLRTSQTAPLCPSVGAGWLRLRETPPGGLGALSQRGLPKPAGNPGGGGDFGSPPAWAWTGRGWGRRGKTSAPGCGQPEPPVRLD